jgi:hypothetical protein
MAIRKLLYNLPLIVTVDTEAGEVISVEEDGDAVHAEADSDVWDENFESVPSDDPYIPEAEEIAEESIWPPRDSLN